MKVLKFIGSVLIDFFNIITMDIDERIDYVKPVKKDMLSV